jgi:hypothetical protein
MNSLGRQFDCPRCSAASAFTHWRTNRGFFCPHCGAHALPVLSWIGMSLNLVMWCVAAGLVCIGAYWRVWWIALPGVALLFTHLEMFSRFRARFLKRFVLFSEWRTLWPW